MNAVILLFLIGLVCMFLEVFTPGPVFGILGGLTLLSPDLSTRLQAAQSVFKSHEESALPVVENALAKETSKSARTALSEARAAIILFKSDASEQDKLDAVVTVADAKWLKDRLKDAPEAKNQIAFADVIVVNKTDLVSGDELRDVEGHIRAINPYATLHRAQRANVSIGEVLGRNAFDLDRILDIEPKFLEAEEHDHGHDHHHHDHDHHGLGHDHHGHGHGLKHYHDEDMQSVSLRSDKALDPEKFFPWVQDLVAKEGPNILRCKGILAFKDDPERFVFQGVHMILDGDHQRPWKEGEERVSRIVFIGRELPEEKIRTGFEACMA